jgi:hypothetical protein
MTDLIVRPFEIKQHDLEPPLIIDLSGSAGDLSTVSSWKVIGSRAGTVVFTDSAPTVTVGSPATTAAVKHTWAAPQTDVSGRMQVEAEATWPGGRKQTFPANGYVIVNVIPDLA